jgi:hypothetical protein
MSIWILPRDRELSGRKDDLTAICEENVGASTSHNHRNLLRYYATNRKEMSSILDEVIPFFVFNLPNPSSHIMALESTQPLTEISTRNRPGGEGRQARKAELIAICEPIA